MLWLLFEIYCYIGIIGTPFAAKYGISGLMVQTIFAFFSSVMDWHLFPHFKKNMRRLNKRGWSSLHVWSVMCLNLCMINAVIGHIYMHCQSTNMVLDKKTILQFVINMSIAEVLFTSAHALLHYTECGSKLHHMHHCCVDASWSTNLIFHPIDMLIEFTTPLLSVVAMHSLLWKNKSSLFLSTLLIHIWYAADHSANLKLPHTIHHSQFNTVFTIYIKKRCRCPRRDKVRALVKNA